MGFYGNLVYNTYGLQEGQIKPQHLDREYWRIQKQLDIKSEKEFRQFLGIANEITDNPIEEIKTVFESEMKKTLYYFSFANINTQKLFGTGVLIGWAVEDDTEKCLLCLSLGNRASQVFYYPLLQLNDKGEWESVLSNIDTDGIQLHYDLECDEERASAINFLTSNSITTSQLKDNAITKDKIYNGAVVTDKIYNGAVVTDKVADMAIIPAKLDRDYLEKTYIKTSIENYNTLFNSIEIIEDTKNGKIPSNNQHGTLYMINSLKLKLPSKYTTRDNEAYYLGLANTPYDFGRCLAWRGNAETIYIISNSNGMLFKIDESTIKENNSEYYGPEQDTNGNSLGKYYKLQLKQVLSPMIAEKSITTEKIADKAVDTDQIAIGAITKDQLEKDAIVAEKIKDGEVTSAKLANTYLDYEHITSISTAQDLNDKISGEKLFRFYVSSDSQLAQSGFSDGNYIAIPRGSSGSSASHALINLNDFTSWYLEAGSGHPEPLTNNWKRNYWNACYSLEEICNQVSPVDSNYPQLSILYVVAGLSGIPAGHYLSYSVSTGNGKKVFLMSGDRLQNYIIYKTLKEDQTFSYTLAKIADVEQKPLDEYFIAANEVVADTWENISTILLQQQIGYEAIFKYAGITNQYTGIFSAAPDNSVDQITVYIKKIGNNVIKTSAYSNTGTSPDYKETLLFLNQSWSQTPKELIKV